MLKLAADLRQAGANLWLDQLDIPPGTRWDRAVEQALEECPRLLGILSPASVTSDNVLDEVHYALEEGKAVIPVLYRDCKIPLRLRRLQRLVVGTGIAELLMALGFEREVASPQPGAVKPKPTDEYVRDDTPVAPLLTPEVERILAELQSESTSHARRSEIGQRSAEIGDPRKGVGVMDGVPDILWRPIPGGEVEIEDRGRFAVATFHMAAFPVTFGQFRAFLEVKDGYDNNRWWKDLRREDRNPAWQSPLANHPVTDVSWYDATAYDATAFCCWLSAGVGFEVRLPDEQEWQWAAQSARAGLPILGARSGGRVLRTRTNLISATPRRWACIRTETACKRYRTWRAMSGSGAGTSIRQAQGLGCCAAAPGATIRTSRARTAAAAAIRATVATTSAFGLCARLPSAEHWISDH